MFMPVASKNAIVCIQKMVGEGNPLGLNSKVLANLPSQTLVLVTQAVVVPRDIDPLRLNGKIELSFQLTSQQIKCFFIILPAALR